MHRTHHKWYSRSLTRDMELLIFGHAGPPMIVFPSSMGAFFEYEDQGMVGALAEKLERGGLQLFCVSSVDSESWYNRRVHPRDRVRRHLQYEDYVLADVVPLIHHVNHHQSVGTTGCSFGAYHAMVFALRHPYTFTWSVTMSGAFDIGQFLDGYHDEDCYFLNPSSFVPNLTDPYYLDQYRRNKWVLATGEHDICRAATESFSGLLHYKGIPHSLHVWGDGAKHDWPYWRPMARAYLP
jgi:esterase/lipase superfamily enzyme